MMLYVVRHAIAEEAPDGATDPSRTLTPGGRRKMEAAARGLRALGVEPDVILTSPLVRAVETARIVVAALRGAPEPREMEALVPDTPPLDTVKALRLFARSQELMIVGHEPNLSSVVALLLTGAADGATIEMKKGACAALELTSFAPRGGVTLRWLMPPRALRLAGR